MKIPVPKINMKLILKCAFELNTQSLMRLQSMHEEKLAESSEFLKDYSNFIADMEKVGLGIDAELFRRAGTTFEFKPEEDPS